MRHTKLLGALLGVAALGIGSPAFAHAELVSSNPAAKSTVAAPKTISLTFEEAPIPRFSSVELVMVGGHNMNMPVKTAFHGKTVVATPQGALMKGNYQVKWSAAADDGHKLNGVVPFTVR